MGLFSSKKVVSVAANTARLIQDIPNTVKNSTVEAILNEQGIVNTIQVNLTSGISNRMREIQRYGRDYYTYGLPTGKLEMFGIQQDAVESYLASAEGESVTLLDVDVDTDIGQLMVEQWLVQTYNFNPMTGLLEQYPSAVVSDISAWNAAGEAANTDQVTVKTDELLTDWNTTTVTETVEGDVTIRTTVTLTATVDVTTVSDIQNQVFLGDQTRTSDPIYSIIRRISFRLIDNYKEIDYELDLHCFNEQTYTNTFSVNVHQHELVESITDNGDGSFTTVTVSDTETDFVHQEQTTHTVSNSKTYAISKTVQYTPVYRIIYNEYSLPSFREAYEVHPLKIALLFKRADESFGYRIVEFDDHRNDFLREINENLSGYFYPIVPVRRNNTDLTADDQVNTERYQTSRKLLKKLTLDIDEIADAINQNPNVKDIDHAYIYFGVPINTNDKVVNKYLYHFFSILEHKAINAETELTSGGAIGSAFNSHTIYISDVGLNLEVRFNSISREVVYGTIGKKGTVLYSGVAQKKRITYKPILSNNDYTRTRYVDDSYISLQYQITEHSYEVLTVHGLKFVNWVYGNHAVEVELYDVLTEATGHENFLLPLYEPAVKALSLKDRDTLLYYAPHLILNSYEITKVKWYQKGFFGFLLKIAGLIIAIYGIITANPQLATGGLSVATMVWIILKKLFISLIINFTMKLVVKIFGEEIALLLAIAAAAYGLKIQNTGSTWFDVPSSDYFLAASSGLVNKVNDSIQSQIEDLVDSANAFQKQAKEKMDALADANKLLDTNGVIDPLMFTSLDIYYDPTETPQEYYERTVHTGNPGAVAYDVLHRYVDMMLDLDFVEKRLTNGDMYA
jgi:hypothetical protein